MIWTALTCKRIAPRLAPFSEDALPARAAARVAAHLEVCPACRAEVTTLRAIGAVLRQRKPAAPAPAADLWSRVHAEIAPPEQTQIGTDRAAPRRDFPRPGWLLPAAGLAAAALALVAGPALRPPAPLSATTAVRDTRLLVPHPAPRAFAARPDARPAATAQAPVSEPVRVKEAVADGDPFTPLEARTPRPAPRTAVASAPRAVKSVPSGYTHVPRHPNRPSTPPQTTEGTQTAQAAGTLGLFGGGRGVGGLGGAAALNVTPAMKTADASSDAREERRGFGPRGGVGGMGGGAAPAGPAASPAAPPLDVVTSSAPAASAALGVPGPAADVPEGIAFGAAARPFVGDGSLSAGRVPTRPPSPVAAGATRDVPATLSAVDAAAAARRQRGLFYYSHR